MLIALALLGLVSAVGGAIIAGIGASQQAQAQADANEVQADNLEMLTEDGGYYDQVMTALQTELDDIEADRDAAAVNLQMTENQLRGEIGLSKVQEAAQIAGQAVQGLETARSGAEATGAQAAKAGAGGVSVGSGSVLRSAAAVNKVIGRRMAMTNLNINAARLAGALQRETLEDNIVRARLQYQDTLRGLDTREAQTTAQQTLTEYNQENTSDQIDQLRTEADWLNTTGQTLIWAGTAFSALGAGAQGVTSVYRAMEQSPSLDSTPTDLSQNTAGLGFAQTWGGGGGGSEYTPGMGY